jgi:protein TonB
VVKKRRKSRGILRTLFHRFLVVLGALGLALVFFLVLPFMQVISEPPEEDLVLQPMDTANVPPPPPPPEEEPEEEEEPEDEPPELEEEAMPLDLSTLELAIEPGFSDGWATEDIASSLNTVVADSGAVQDIFSMSDLDQKPRVIYQPGPSITREVRQKSPGKVEIIFIVDQSGRVENPIVQKSSDPVFEKPALAAVRQWKFEPGKRNGKPVQFRMRVPITFPKMQ